VIKINQGEAVVFSYKEAKASHSWGNDIRSDTRECWDIEVGRRKKWFL